MEDTLRVIQVQGSEMLAAVLILVLMEDTLRDTGFNGYIVAFAEVLILVLMEDTLREVQKYGGRL